jgi:hypothetical protein
MSMARSGATFAALAMSVALAGCAAPTPTPSLQATVPATPGEIVGGPVRMEDMSLDADHRTLHLEFIGAAPYTADDPCSAAYTAKTEVVGDELQAAVYQLRNPYQPATPVPCLAIGVIRHVVVTLPEPFEGILAHDPSGQEFFLAPPPTLARITGLPLGWTLIHQGNLPGSSRTWLRAWSPTPGWPPAEGASMVVLTQCFGQPVNCSGGQNPEPVTVNGSLAVLFVYPPTGDLTISWGLGGDGMALEGNLRDFSKAEFVALANSVVQVAP